MLNTPPIRLLLVDDHIIVREGLAAMFARVPEVQVLGQTGDGAEAVKLYAALKPDVVLLDIRMPGIDGVEVLRRLKAAHPEAIALMLVGSSLPPEIARVRRMGASGYLSKDLDCQQIVAAIRRVWSRKTSWVSAPGSMDPNLPELTEREFQILELARRGLGNADIGKVLSISEHTVKSHVKTLLKKLDAADRAEAVGRGFELGLLH
jgi:DNA-binding NarL/FixJ family response regulator